MTTGIESVWVLATGFAVLAVGVIIGIVIGYLGLGDSRKAQELQDKLDELQQEFDQYRDKVSNHFLQTSALVQKMTSSYRQVYEHLASGSEELCATPVDTPQLDLPDHPALDVKQDIDTNTETDSRAVPEPEPQAVPLEVPDQAVREEDEVLGDAPQVPDLELEIPLHKTAGMKS